MKKPLGPRIAFAAAVLCYVAAVVTAFAAFLHENASPEDPVRAALMATVVFFVGCGVVLHVIGRAHLKGILSGSGEIDDR